MKLKFHTFFLLKLILLFCLLVYRKLMHVLTFKTVVIFKLLGLLMHMQKHFAFCWWKKSYLDLQFLFVFLTVKSTLKKTQRKGRLLLFDVKRKDHTQTSPAWYYSVGAVFCCWSCVSFQYSFNLLWLNA